MSVGFAKILDVAIFRFEISEAQVKIVYNKF